MSDSPIIARKVVNYNADTKTQTIFNQHDDGAVTIQKVKDNTELFDDNKSLHNMTSSLDRWGDGKVCLRGVPFELIEKWKQQGLWTKDNFWKVLLSDEAKPYKVFG